MKAIATDIPDLKFIEPTLFGCARCFFSQSFHRSKSADDVVRDVDFVQNDQSRCYQNVLRVLYHQIQKAKGKLVCVMEGAVIDEVADSLHNATTFLKCLKSGLFAEIRRMSWISEGFANGFLISSSAADVLYKVTDCGAPGFDRSVAVNALALNFRWLAREGLNLPLKDRGGTLIAEAEQCS